MAIKRKHFRSQKIKLQTKPVTRIIADISKLAPIMIPFVYSNYIKM